MHADELVNMENWSADNFIFDFASFEESLNMQLCFTVITES